MCPARVSIRADGSRMLTIGYVVATKYLVGE